MDFCFEGLKVLGELLFVFWVVEGGGWVKRWKDCYVYA